MGTLCKIHSKNEQKEEIVTYKQNITIMCGIYPTLKEKKKQKQKAHKIYYNSEIHFNMDENFGLLAQKPSQKQEA